jgi:ribosome biogenesis protein ERB1
MKTLAEKKRD